METILKKNGREIALLTYELDECNEPLFDPYDLLGKGMDYGRERADLATSFWITLKTLKLGFKNVVKAEPTLKEHGIYLRHPFSPFALITKDAMIDLNKYVERHSK